MDTRRCDEVFDAMPFSELSKHIPGQPHKSTLDSWVKVGRLNKFTGERVFMNSRMGTNGLIATLDDYRDFINALNKKAQTS